MKDKKLLLLSSSRVGNTEYLSHAQEMIAEHLEGVTELLFIPYAGVTINYDQYTEMVQLALSSSNLNSTIKVTGIHQTSNAKQAVEQAQAIAIGGGNTFHLLHQLYQHNLINAINNQINKGIPYIGWSAGSNVAGATIRTTNDMPIIEPSRFNALNLVPFQINPHYTDHNPPGHNGETREQRLAEFMALNPETPIVGIVEGTALKQSHGELHLIGGKNGFVFKSGKKEEIGSGTNLSYLLN